MPRILVLYCRILLPITGDACRIQIITSCQFQIGALISPATLRIVKAPERWLCIKLLSLDPVPSDRGTKGEGETLRHPELVEGWQYQADCRLSADRLFSLTSAHKLAPFDKLRMAPRKGRED